MTFEDMIVGLDDADESPSLVQPEFIAERATRKGMATDFSARSKNDDWGNDPIVAPKAARTPKASKSEDDWGNDPLVGQTPMPKPRPAEADAIVGPVPLPRARPAQAPGLIQPTQAMPPVQPLDEVKPPAEHNSITRGFVSGMLKQNPEMTAEALEGMSHLAPEQFKEALQSGSKDMRGLAAKSPAEYAQKSTSMWDIKNLDDALTWAGETLGQGLASTVPSIAAGTVGAVAGGRVGGKTGAVIGGTAGATVPSAALNYGEVYKALKEAGVKPEDAARYGAYAVPVLTGLDMVSIGPIISRLGGIAEVKRQAARMIAARISAEAAKGAGREGITEALQEVTKDIDVSLAADKPFWTVEHAKGWVESGVGGALVGGATGAVSGVMPDRIEQQARPAEVPVPPPVPVAPEEIVRQILGQPSTPPPTAAPEAPVAPAPAPASNPGQAAAPTDEKSPAPISVAPAEAATSKSDVPAENAPPPAEPPGDETTALLRGYGYSQQQIEDMSPAQREQEAAAAKEAGTEPAFGQDDHVVGSRSAPVEVKTPADLQAVTAAVPEDYTPAEAEANNRKLGHMTWNGLEASIEAGPGQGRKWLNKKTGETGETVSPAAIGYFKGTVGGDKMHLDVYFGPNPESPHVWVVDEKDRETGRWRQHKVMAGFNTEQEARDAYLGTSSKSEKTLQAITPTTVDGLKDWIANGDLKSAYLKSKTAPPPKETKSDKPLSLLQFIASKDGLSPDPELGAIGLTGSNRMQIPGRKGFFSPVRPTGMSLDQMREAAEEAGYFRGTGEATSTVRDFLDAIDGELRGQRKMPEGHEAEPSDRETQRLEDENANRDATLAQNRAEIEEMLAAYGQPDSLNREEYVRLAAEIMADEGLGPDEALERAAMRNLEIDMPVTADEITATFDDFGVFDAVQPGPTQADERPAADESAGRERPREEGRPAEAGSDVPDAGQDREGSRESAAAEEAEGSPRPGEEVSDEVGADGKPQIVLPGAEKESQGKQVQRKADAKLKPKAPQKAADEGLFGDEKDQTDLLDVKPAAPKIDADVKAAFDDIFGEEKPKAKKAKIGDTEIRMTPWKDVGDGYAIREISEKGPKVAAQSIQEIRTPEGNILTRGIDSNGSEYQEFEMGHNPMSKGGMAWVDKAIAYLEKRARMPKVEHTKADEELYSLGPRQVRANGIPKSAGDVLSPHKSDQTIKSHPDYTAAKAGDPAAALRLVEANLTPAITEQASKQFGKDAIYAPVIAEEQSGHNAIPMAMAEYLAHSAGGGVVREIKQTNRAFHTGAKAMERLAARAQFDGPVEAGRNYVLVDDVSVMGSTLADLADHIQRNGGNIVGVVTLANAGRSGVMTAPKAAINEIERRFGNEVRELFHLDPASLTADEAKYLLNFRDADALRTRSAAAERERAERLRSKGISEAKSLRVGDSAAPQGGVPASGSTITSEARAKIESALTAVIRKIAGPNVKVRFVDRHEVKPPSGWGSYGDGVTTAAGSYLPADPLITIALADPKYPLIQSLATAFHEAFHHLENRLLTEQEMAVLKREDARLREIVKRAFGFTDQQIKEIAGFEIRAMAFEYYAHQIARGLEPKGLHIGVRRAFERLMDIFRRVRNAINGLGYQNADDILQAAFDGKYADRADFSSAAATEQASIRQMTEKGEAQLPAKIEITPPAEIISDRLAERGMLRLAKISRALQFGKIPLTELRTKFQDKFIRVKHIEQAAAKASGKDEIPEGQSAYLAETLYYGRTGQQLESLEKRHLDPLVKEIKRADLTLEQIDEFLMARHAPERNREIRKINPDLVNGSGMSDAKAQKIIDKVDASGKRAEYDAIEKRVRDIIDETRETLLKAGLISKETADAWAKTYKYYVPLRGFAEGSQMEEDYVASGKGYDIRGPEAKQAFGRSSRAEGPLAYIMHQAEIAIVRAEKNKVGNTFLRFVQSNPQASLWTVDTAPLVRTIDAKTGLVTEVGDPSWVLQPNVFSTKIGGKVYRIALHGDAGLKIARALKNMGSSNANSFIRALGTITQVLARINTTLNPEFTAANFVRDVGEAAINNQAQSKEFRNKFWKHLLPSVGGAFMALTDRKGGKYAQAFRELDQAGGRIRFFGLENPDDVKANIGRRLSRLEGGLKNNTFAAGRALYEAVEIMNGAIENGTRLAAFMAAREVGLTAGKSASVARELTVNFNRKGEYGAAISALYMFGNASIQGTARMALAMRHPRVRRAAYATATLGSAAALLGLSMGGDDDDGIPYYMKIAPWERDKNLILMWPKGYGRDGQYIKIPLPFAYGMFFSAGTHAALMFYGAEKWPKALTSIAGSIVDSFNVLGTDHNLASQFLPTLLRPPVDIYTGTKWTGAPMHPTRYPDNSKPDSELSFDSNTGFAKESARILNRWTGGSPYKSGAVDVYPGSIDYLVDFLTGGLGRFVRNAYSTGVGISAGEEWDPNKTPIVRRFAGATNEAGDRAAFTEATKPIMDDVAALKRARKDLKESQNPTGAEDFIAEMERKYDVRPGKKKGTVVLPQEAIIKKAKEGLDQLDEDEETAESSNDRDALDRIKKERKRIRSDAIRELKAMERQPNDVNTLPELKVMEQKAMKDGDRDAVIIIRSKIRELNAKKEAAQ